MIHEDISRRWYNFDDSEEIILDDRLKFRELMDILLISG